MADFVFNVAKGRAAHLASLPAANDGLIAVPLEAVGLETDAGLKDKGSLSAVLAGSTNEQTTMGRKALTGVVVAVDNANDWAWVDAADFTWSDATGADVAAIVVCYVPDVGVSADTAIIPLTKHDFAVEPSGADVIALVNASGLYRAS